MKVFTFCYFIFYILIANLYAVSLAQAKAYLGKNTTLIHGNSSIESVDHYINLNLVCYEKGIGIPDCLYNILIFNNIVGFVRRDRIPPTVSNKNQILAMFEDLENEPDNWRGMKVIILGNSKIGKTTFVKYLQKMLNIEIVSNWSSYIT